VGGCVCTTDQGGHHIWIPGSIESHGFQASSHNFDNFSFLDHSQNKRIGIELEERMHIKKIDYGTHAFFCCFTVLILHILLGLLKPFCCSGGLLPSCFVDLI
jgi:hypothetical protein